jgi:acetyltransferase EpsM
MTKLVLIGGGGFAKEVQEVAELCGHELVGYAADLPGILNLPYLGAVSTLADQRDKFDAVIMAFGAVDRRSLARRAEVIGELAAMGLIFQSVISPHAIQSKGVTVGDGCFVAHGVVISVDASIGDHVILNSSAIIGHDADVGDRSIIAPGAFLGGAVTVGVDCLIGPGAQILERRRIGDQAIVSVGSTVLRHVAEGATVAPIKSQVWR